jgi:hypothetical protein
MIVNGIFFALISLYFSFSLDAHIFFVRKRKRHVRRKKQKETNKEDNRRHWMRWDSLYCPTKCDCLMFHESCCLLITYWSNVENVFKTMTRAIALRARARQVAFSIDWNERFHRHATVRSCSSFVRTCYCSSSNMFYCISWIPLLWARLTIYFNDKWTWTEYLSWKLIQQASTFFLSTKISTKTRT